jgi:hypothetical protein
MIPDRNAFPYSKGFYEEIQKEIDAMKSEIKICPYCGQPINVQNDAEKYFQKKKQEDGLG